ncbi:BTB/POZ domain-containing protein At2g24240-like [Diospyros lotus]|uniref:BTB/POZ domain-containing protein At2g24240-like n=1 Tax=Diospyros lotus TaxID=55363 RepID=UPI002256EB26|nr:BTB/POZ domain-containing protein At2g24240-like [Diospyros lotus]
MGIQKDRVKFNVGGKIFETTATTLAIAGRNSFFGAMFDEDWNLQTDNSEERFIDRNPDCFAILLDLLRTGELYIPQNIPEKLLYREAQFYGLLDHVRAAKWGQFDGNRLRFSLSIAGQAPGDGTAIRAGPDGSCCVAHGSMVHVYDWMLEEHPPINLDYQRVNDVGWMDPKTIIVSACERLGRGGGGMALFKASTGELKHRFQVSHEDQVKSYTGGALSFSSDYKIFSSCKGRSNEYGIGVWDQITGKQIDFYYEPLGWSLGDADRLQWLHGANCLLVATLFPRKDNCYISLLDFREKSMVWAWSDIVTPATNERRTTDERRVRDAIAMDETSSICVVNEYEDLGFIDLRSTAGSLRWCSRSRLMKGKMPEEPCYPKLAWHEGQLFSSMNDSISVFCGPDWVLTSTLRRSYGGSICDFTIGGDRLFALHSEENVFDIWETPPPPIA